MIGNSGVAYDAAVHTLRQACDTGEGCNAPIATLRDQFAMAALRQIAEWYDTVGENQVAERAYRIADAMLEARKK